MRRMLVGLVTNNIDPKQLGRIQFEVPALTGSSIYPHWAKPKFKSAGSDHGVFYVPEIGDQVNIELEDGEESFLDPDPFWDAAEYKLGDLAQVFTTELPFFPFFRGEVTKGGHRMIFIDQVGAEKFSYEHPIGSKIEIDNTTINIEHFSGAKIEIDATGKVSIWGITEVDIGKSAGVLDLVAMAQKTNDALNSLKTYAAGIKSAISAGTPVPNDGGAAMRTAQVAAMPADPTLTSVACNDVKVT